MNILQISPTEFTGGAERIAWNLFRAYRAAGHTSWLAVGRKDSTDPDVIEIPRMTRTVPWARACMKLRERLAPLESRLGGVWRARRALKTLAGGWTEVRREWGREVFSFPGSRKLAALCPRKPDVVHAHNLHGDYFDLRQLPRLARWAPTVLTLHDAWLLAGHCAHSLDCDRWRQGCGDCPDLALFIPIRRDASAANWRQKQRIYRRSRLYVATPCRWLMAKVEQSMLAPAVIEARLIPNGIDLRVFRPADRQAARQALGLPKDARIILLAAAGIRRNAWKDYATARAAVAAVASQAADARILCAALGETAPEESIGQARVQFFPFTKDPARVALFYQAADVYVHAARAETFPNTILEALACGTPVVAAAVGGVPEQIEDGVNGLLVPPADPAAMAAAIRRMLADASLAMSVREQGILRVRKDFDGARQVTSYLDWFQQIVGRPQRQP
jgi:glycosyltransferase involved in cell wall biosynthesis